MANSNKQQLTIWGRANSVNVQKVLWCLAELDLAFDRIDAGMQFGKNNEPAYLAMNPNGRVPTLVDGDYVLWESNSVMRYLCMAYGGAAPACPPPPRRAGLRFLRMPAMAPSPAPRCAKSGAPVPRRWAKRAATFRPLGHPARAP